MQMGDSAAYIHSPEGVLHKAPTLTLLGDIHRNERGELTRCIGSMGNDTPDISFGHLRRGEAVLVATDGFTEKYETKELALMLSIKGRATSRRLEKRLMSIGKEAGRRGSCDNRSAVYIR